MSEDWIELRDKAFQAGDYDLAWQYQSLINNHKRALEIKKQRIRQAYKNRNKK